MSVDYRATIVIGYPLDDGEVRDILLDDEELELDEYVFLTDCYRNNWVFGQRIFASEQTELNARSRLPIEFLNIAIKTEFETIQKKYIDVLNKYNLNIHLADELPKVYLVQEVL